MAFALDAAWAMTRVLSYAGLAAALAGVAVFGWHFVRINAAAARTDTGEIPPASWRGKGAILGYQILFGAVVILVTAVVFAALLPPRP